ncbi:hypothetical protein [Gluconobacter cerinus]|uniref:hypothetical protein n=1 Tax=Gluconobacter cerinus TaxID=38307 RepID=UPI001B8BD3ED|nr:hypothetical protein [Gluconobacter cerinus]MBS0984266.1 hypothetical protein [Gluconobacter cerinus]
MKYAFIVSFLVVCLGLAFGYPSREMLQYALNHPGHSQFNIGSIVVLAALVCPVAGFLLAIRTYTRWLMRFHHKMTSQGLWGENGPEGGTR